MSEQTMVLACALWIPLVSCAVDPIEAPRVDRGFEESWSSRAVLETVERSTPPPPRTSALQEDPQLRVFAGLLTIDEEIESRARSLRNDPNALDRAWEEGLERAVRRRLVADLSPAVRRAREGYRASLERYDSARYLADLVTQNRTFTRELETRVGSARHTERVATIAPSPSTEALRGAWIDADVERAREAWRLALRQALVENEKAEAAERFTRSEQAILEEQEALYRLLLPVIRERLAVGASTLGDALAVEIELALVSARARTAADELRRARARRNAVWNRSMDAELAPAETWSADAELPPRDVMQARARELRSEVRLAQAESLRLEAALGLAERMSTPLPGLQSSTMERGAFGEGGVDRDPRLIAPRSFPMDPVGKSVGSGLARELRARLEAMRARIAEASDQAAYAVEEAWVAWERARRDHDVAERIAIPKARESYESLLRSYDGNRARFSDVWLAARRLLEARLSAAHARRALEDANAQWISAIGWDPALPFPQFTDRAADAKEDR